LFIVLHNATLQNFLLTDFSSQLCRLRIFFTFSLISKPAENYTAVAKENVVI